MPKKPKITGPSDPSRCAACPGKYHVIHGDGPVPCRVLFLGQNPGKTEEASACKNECGQVFIGDAGKELNEHYLCLAGLSRYDDAYVDNTVHCHTDNDRKPTSREIDACSARFLPGLLERVTPKVVVLLGGVSCSLVPDLSLDTHHGYPFLREFFGAERWIVPMYHPAAGMHNSAMMTPLIEDFTRLNRILRGDVAVPIDQYPNPTYEDLTGNHEKLRHILASAVQKGIRVMARDTETMGKSVEDGGATPWCSTFTLEPGTGYMIRAVDIEGLRILGSYFKYFRSILHNSIYDLPVEEKMGLPRTPIADLDDSLQIAFHQGTFARIGLKVLAWRLAGMDMLSYPEVVTPHSREAAVDWLAEAYDIASQVPKRTVIEKSKRIPKGKAALERAYASVQGYQPDEKDGHWHYTITEETDSELAKKILWIYNHTSKPTPAEGKAYSPWDAWQELIVEKLGAEQADTVHSRIGEMPMAGIERVFEKDPRAAIVYACRDSDSTGRINPLLVNGRSKYDGRVVDADIDFYEGE